MDTKLTKTKILIFTLALICFLLLSSMLLGYPKQLVAFFHRDIENTQEFKDEAKTLWSELIKKDSDQQILDQTQLSYYKRTDDGKILTNLKEAPQPEELTSIIKNFCPCYYHTPNESGGGETAGKPFFYETIKANQPIHESITHVMIGYKNPSKDKKSAQEKR